MTQLIASFSVLALIYYVTIAVADNISGSKRLERLNSARACRVQDFGILGTKHIN